MPRYLICHAREIRRFAWFEAPNEAEAIKQAEYMDNAEADWDGWETEDNDPGEFEVREGDDPLDCQCDLCRTERAAVEAAEQHP